MQPCRIKVLPPRVSSALLAAASHILLMTFTTWLMGQWPGCCRLIRGGPPWTLPDEILYEQERKKYMLTRLESKKRRYTVRLQGFLCVVSPKTCNICSCRCHFWSYKRKLQTKKDERENTCAPVHYLMWSTARTSDLTERFYIEKTNNNYGDELSARRKTTWSLLRNLPAIIPDKLLNY